MAPHNAPIDLSCAVHILLASTHAIRWKYALRSIEKQRVPVSQALTR